MTVRLTPTESDTTPPPQVPAPPNPSDVQVTTGSPEAPATAVPTVQDVSDVSVPSDAPDVAHGPALSDSPEGPDREGSAETRQAIREARRRRRRTAWLCAAVVAVALALTIVVVSLARVRPVTPSASLATTTATSGRPVRVPTATLDRSSRPIVPSRGATASEGGTR